MSSGRPSRTVALNAGRRRSDSFCSFPRVPYRLSPSSRPSISRPNNLRCPAIRPSLSIRNRPCRPSNRRSPPTAKATRCPNSRACLTAPQRRSIPRTPATGRPPLAIRPSKPGMEAFSRSELRALPPHPNTSLRRARRPNSPPATPASRRRPCGPSSRRRVNSRTVFHPRRPRKAASPIRRRVFLPSNPRHPLRAIRPPCPHTRSSRKRPIHSRERPISRRLPPSRLKATYRSHSRRPNRPKADPTCRSNRRRTSIASNPNHSSRHLLLPLPNGPCRRQQASSKRRLPCRRPLGRLPHPSGRKHPGSVRPPLRQLGPKVLRQRRRMARPGPFPRPSRQRPPAPSVPRSARPPRPSLRGRHRSRARVPRYFAPNNSRGHSPRNRPSPTRLAQPGMHLPLTATAASTFALRDVFTP